MKQIPAKVMAAQVFYEGSSVPLGTADITLPSLEAMSETMSGAGIAGEYDAPTPGFFSSITLGLAWKTVDRAALKLVSSKLHALDIRAAQQIYDVTGNKMTVEKLKVTVRGNGKSLDLGSLATNSPTDGASEIEIAYLKVEVDREKLLELDKFAFVYFVDGKDEMTDIREALGM